jgi:hypothetical protein
MYSLHHGRWEGNIPADWMTWAWAHARCKLADASSNTGAATRPHIIAPPATAAHGRLPHSGMLTLAGITASMHAAAHVVTVMPATAAQCWAEPGGPACADDCCALACMYTHPVATCGSANVELAVDHCHRQMLERLIVQSHLHGDKVKKRSAAARKATAVEQPLGETNSEKCSFMQ